MVKKYLSGVAYFCATPKYTYALGFGMGLICTSFWKSHFGFGLFFGLGITPAMIAVKHLEDAQRISQNSYRMFFLGVVCGAMLFASVLIPSFFLH